MSTLLLLLLLLAASASLAQQTSDRPPQDDPWFCSSIAAQQKPGLQQGPASPIIEKWLCRNPRTGEQILKSEETLMSLDYPQRSLAPRRQPRQSPSYSSNSGQDQESQTDLPDGGLPNDGKGTIRIRPGRR